MCRSLDLGFEAKHIQVESGSELGSDLPVACHSLHGGFPDSMPILYLGPRSTSITISPIRGSRHATLKDQIMNVVVSIMDEPFEYSIFPCTVRYVPFTLCE